MIFLFLYICFFYYYYIMSWEFSNLLLFLLYTCVIRRQYTIFFSFLEKTKGETHWSNYMHYWNHKNITRIYAIYMRIMYMFCECYTYILVRGTQMFVLEFLWYIIYKFYLYIQYILIHIWIIHMWNGTFLITAHFVARNILICICASINIWL